MAQLRRVAESKPPASEVPPAGCVVAAYEQLESSYDDVNGGFGDAPKFPRPVWEGANGVEWFIFRRRSDCCRYVHIAPLAHLPHSGDWQSCPLVVTVLHTRQESSETPPAPNPPRSFLFWTGHAGADVQGCCAARGDGHGEEGAGDGHAHTACDGKRRHQRPPGPRLPPLLGRQVLEAAAVWFLGSRARTRARAAHVAWATGTLHSWRLYEEGSIRIVFLTASHLY